MVFDAIIAAIFSQSSHGMPMMYANGMNSFPKNNSNDTPSKPTKWPNHPVRLLINAMNDTNATRLAAMPNIKFVAVDAPFDAASNTDESVL